MNREEKIKDIIQAEQKEDFTNDIYNVEMLEHQESLPNGNTRRWTDRFDCLEVEEGACFVWFIAGTDHQDFRVPIESLTDKSINKLYDCVGHSDCEGLTCFEVETKYKSGRIATEHIKEHDDEEMWRLYDQRHNRAYIESSAIVDAFPA